MTDERFELHQEDTRLNELDTVKRFEPVVAKLRANGYTELQIAQHCLTQALRDQSRERSQRIMYANKQIADGLTQLCVMDDWNNLLQVARDAISRCHSVLTELVAEQDKDPTPLEPGCQTLEAHVLRYVSIERRISTDAIDRWPALMLDMQSLYDEVTAKRRANETAACR